MKRISKYRTPIAVLISFIWLGLIWWLFIGPRGGYSKLTELTLNEVGDFLAGTFAPLAFFWFVVAYWQQSEELSLTREEMERQGKTISDNEVHARRDIFFRYLDIVSVEQVSIVSRIMWLLKAQDDAEVGDVWKRYSAGNKDAWFNNFVRNLYDHNQKWMETTEKTETDVAKRIVVNARRFISNFEELCDQLDEKSDRDGLIRGRIERSAMGRVYRGLCLYLKSDQKLRYTPKLSSFDDLRS